MAEKSIKIEITTPQKYRHYDEAASCSASGVLGRFQILVDHAPFVSQLEIGELKVETPQETLYFSAGGGFIQVSGNKALFLLDSCESPEEIDVERAKDAQGRAKNRLEKKEPDIDIWRAKLALARALNRLRVAKKIY